MVRTDSGSPLVGGQAGMTPAELAALRLEIGLPRIKPMSEVTPTESQSQMALFRWAALAAGTRPDLAWLFAVPNGGFRTAATAGKMKGEGAKPGVWDIGLCVARGGFHGLWLELKTAEVPAIPGIRKRKPAGKLSPDQLRWQAHYTAQGYCARVAYGFEHARQTILEYLDGLVGNKFDPRATPGAGVVEKSLSAGRP